LSLSSQKYGFGIRDLRSGIRKKTYFGSRIPENGVKKAPDPGSWIRILNTGYSTELCCTTPEYVQLSVIHISESAAIYQAVTSEEEAVLTEHRRIRISSSPLISSPSSLSK
jgi:hypothetical protein